MLNLAIVGRSSWKSDSFHSAINCKNKIACQNSQSSVLYEYIIGKTLVPISSHYGICRANELRSPDSGAMTRLPGHEQAFMLESSHDANQLMPVCGVAGAFVALFHFPRLPETFGGES